jgi:hypothetical protein
MKIVQFQNHYADREFYTRGFMANRLGAPIEFWNRDYRALAVAMADTSLCRLPRSIIPQLRSGRLYLLSYGHAVLCRRLVGRHLLSAIRRLNKLRKKTRNDNPKNPAAPKRGRQPDELSTAAAIATETRARAAH